MKCCLLLKLSPYERLGRSGCRLLDLKIETYPALPYLIPPPGNYHHIHNTNRTPCALAIHSQE